MDHVFMTTAPIASNELLKQPLCVVGLIFKVVKVLL